MRKSFAARFLALSLVCFANWVSRAKSEEHDQFAKDLQVYVLVYNYAPISASSLYNALERASWIFRRVGVQMVWVDQPSLRTPSCRYTLKDMDLVLQVLPHPRPSLPSKTALGEALLCELGRDSCFASVFHSRVQEQVEQLRFELASPAPLPTILGHAVAHELGHLLLGSNSHDEAGIMQAKWRTRELQRAAKGWLVFTPEQAARIRNEVSNLRTQKTVAVSLVP